MTSAKLLHVVVSRVELLPAFGATRSQEYARTHETKCTEKKMEWIPKLLDTGGEPC